MGKTQPGELLLTVAKVPRTASGVNGGVRIPLAPCSIAAAETLPEICSFEVYAGTGGMEIASEIMQRKRASRSADFTHHFHGRMGNEGVGGLTQQNDLGEVLGEFLQLPLCSPQVRQRTIQGRYSWKPVVDRGWETYCRGSAVRLGRWRHHWGHWRSHDGDDDNERTRRREWRERRLNRNRSCESRDRKRERGGESQFTRRIEHTERTKQSHPRPNYRFE